MAGEGKFGVNAESIYVHTESGPVPLLEFFADNGGTASWGDLTGKPSEFPPADHEHAAADVTSGTFEAARIPALPQTKVTGLADALDGKQATGSYATSTALSDLAERVAAAETRLDGLEPDA